jgi:hypothetical protein
VQSPSDNVVDLNEEMSNPPSPSDSVGDEQNGAVNGAALSPERCHSWPMRQFEAGDGPWNHVSSRISPRPSNSNLGSANIGLEGEDQMPEDIRPEDDDDDSGSTPPRGRPLLPNGESSADEER